MTFATQEGNGSLSLGPLDPRRLRSENPGRLSGPLTLLGELVDDASQDKLVSLEELTVLDREPFRKAETSRHLYALSSLWVHFIGTVNRSTAGAFRGYLADISKQPPGAGPAPDLLASLSVDSARLEAEFRSWLEWLAAEIPGL